MTLKQQRSLLKEAAPSSGTGRNREAWPLGEAKNWNSPQGSVRFLTHQAKEENHISSLHIVPHCPQVSSH